MSELAVPNTTTPIAKSTQLVISEAGVYTFELVEPGIELELRGTFQSVQQEKINVEVIIHHTVAHTKANTVLKGVARDTSKIRFVGRIIIDKNCPDTNSFLTERVLLLSDQAQAETVPDLEIESDDVKCSHAASISRIPESQLFYLRSRGLTQAQAETLIIEGFLSND